MKKSAVENAQNTALTRRQVLKNISLMVGGAIATPLANSFLSGAVGADIPAGTAGKALSAAQADFIAQIADIIIPPTETAGGRVAGVVGFMDRYLSDYESAATAKKILQDITSLMKAADKALKGGFMQASLEAQTQWLTEYDKAAYGKNWDSRADYRTIKHVIVVGYYSSEIGATEELDYQPVPGPYQGEIEVTEDTRNYAI